MGMMLINASYILYLIPQRVSNKTKQNKTKQKQKQNTAAQLKQNMFQSIP